MSDVDAQCRSERQNQLSIRIDDPQNGERMIQAKEGRMGIQTNESELSRSCKDRNYISLRRKAEEALPSTRDSTTKYIHNQARHL